VLVYNLNRNQHLQLAPTGYTTNSNKLYFWHTKNLVL